MLPGRRGRSPQGIRTVQRSGEYKQTEAFIFWFLSESTVYSGQEFRRETGDKAGRKDTGLNQHHLHVRLRG